ncbi:outer membrane lipoprotein-sorting protein [Anaeromyxobacter diazotrophicus]|uniref:Outer membrane lipoprotein-sorting protein n=1 Tax=Anaeromyxobacter diazotrophicus TaxID=2590199 RepID=A0A7I9VN26_9BACT|nr:outer membrane lipoprotein-sorting protein [Anaeromyxobacter diazotrophicus]GEJ57781.1 outer membrane lipoprotein-sorting protein [Anaeromyxobacter diazotrophicus]
MRGPLAACWIVAALAASPARGLSPVETEQVVRGVDARQASLGDYKADCYMEQKEQGKTDLVYELVVYRRDADEKLMLLFTAPRTEQGKGYLRADKNLWFYDPTVGRWERRTERERIGGTDARRNDFDESRLDEEYHAVWEKDGTLGVYEVHQLLLTVKPGVDVAYPQVRLWVDGASGNVLKRQDLAASGKLLRTSLYPRWKKVWSESKRGELWYPEEIRVYDELERGSSTRIVVRAVDLRPLETNLFTKAFLEGKSR